MSHSQLIKYELQVQIALCSPLRFQQVAFGVCCCHKRSKVIGWEVARLDRQMSSPGDSEGAGVLVLTGMGG